MHILQTEEVVKETNAERLNENGLNDLESAYKKTQNEENEDIDLNQTGLQSAEQGINFLVLNT